MANTVTPNDTGDDADDIALMNEFFATHQYTGNTVAWKDVPDDDDEEDDD